MIRKLAQKNNKLADLFENSIWRILRNPISSKADLMKLTKRLGLDVSFDWLDNYEPSIENQILNTDADHIGGTHWVAIHKDYYFDPLGLPIARDDLLHLQYTYIPIQDYRQGGCGLYCVLFIWYAEHDDLDAFYNLFD